MKIRSIGLLSAAIIAATSGIYAGEDTSDDALASQVRATDSQFWKAYNGPNFDSLARFLTTDVEFYHDKGGVTLGKDALLESIRRTLGTSGRHLRREEIPETIKIYILRNNGEPYGAVESGEHLFYLTENGKPEYLDGKARFVTLWLKEGDNFKISRELSFDHQPAVPKRTELSLSDAELDQCAGQFNAEHSGSVTVRRESGHLIASIGNNSYELIPESKTSFFVRGRDLTFEFLIKGNAASGFLVRERNAVVDRAKLANAY
jgi:ketosteroid isomerase-like protein